MVTSFTLKYSTMPTPQKDDTKPGLNDLLSLKKTNPVLLTKREIEVMVLICKEYSAKQIAGELEISTHTVESHKKALRVKTKSFTLVGVAMYAIRNHIFFRWIAFLLSCMGGTGSEDIMMIIDN